MTFSPLYTYGSKMSPSNLDTFRQQKTGRDMVADGVLVRGRNQKTFEIDVNDVWYREFFLDVLVGKNRVFLLGECNDLGFVYSAVGNVVV